MCGLNEPVAKIDGIEIDACLIHIIKALHDAGMETMSCCCGHNIVDGYIRLKDRILIVSKEQGERESARRYYQQFEPLSRPYLREMTKRDK